MKNLGAGRRDIGKINLRNGSQTVGKGGSWIPGGWEREREKQEMPKEVRGQFFHGLCRVSIQTGVSSIHPVAPLCSLGIREKRKWGKEHEAGQGEKHGRIKVGKYLMEE